MSNLDRLKRRLVGAAIDENVELISGRPPRQLVRGRRFWTRRRAFRLVGAPTLLALAVLATGRFLPETWIQSLPRSVARLLGATNAPRTIVVASAPPVIAASPTREPGGAIRSVIETRRYRAPARPDPALFPLGVRRVVIDPGHGGENRGTSAGDLVEKEITLDLARRLAPMLGESGFDVLMTREGDADIDLADRVAYANEHHGDLFLSIHVNWLGKEVARGIETFYLGPTDDPELTELASQENRLSGYSLGDFRRLLEGVYEEVRGVESHTFATKIHGALYDRLTDVSPDLQDRGVKTAPFVVLIGTEMPAVLAEVGCLSSTREVRLLNDSSYRDTIAKALHDGVVAYAASLPDPAPAGTIATARSGPMAATPAEAGGL